ncbi:hypothetical protein ABPG75_000819 [Micractinium tetrahymenae]
MAAEAAPLSPLPAPVLAGRGGPAQSRLAAPSRLQRWGQWRRRQAAPAPAARREQAPPGPSRAYRASRRSSRRQQRREPFDAELLVLFGTPCVVLLVAFAFNDPPSLAVPIPLALLVPGPRDVLLSVASDMLRGMSRAARFVSRDEGDSTAEATQEDLPQARRQARVHQPVAGAQQRRQPSPGCGTSSLPSAAAAARPGTPTALPASRLSQHSSAPTAALPPAAIPAAAAAAGNARGSCWQPAACQPFQGPSVAPAGAPTAGATAAG